MLRLTCLLLLLLPGLAAAAEFPCPWQVAGGRAPVLMKQSLEPFTERLCFPGNAVLHSGVSRTPLYSAELLTRARLQAAAGLPRHGQFHAEPRLPPEQRADLADYLHSGFDRGHMAPNGDMGDEAAQAESFSLANIVPQAHGLNTGLWAQIEGAVRAYALRRGRLYVVTGPAFAGADLETVGRVLVPTHVWKAIYDPGRGLAAAYVAPNRDQGGWQPMSLARLAAFTGIEVFPSVRGLARQIPMRLPPPEHQRGKYR